MSTELPEPPPIKCPKCGSTQITAGKHGFSSGKAVGGALLTGGIGLLAGMHGSKKIEITCLNCGNKFKPGQKSVDERTEINKEKLAKLRENPPETNPFGCAFLLLIVVAILWYFLS